MTRREIKIIMSASATLLIITLAGCAGAAQTITPRSDPARRSQPARLILEWVGDIALSTEAGLPSGGLTESLAPVRPQLRHADLTIGNLEGTLSVGGLSKCGVQQTSSCFAFQAPPAYAAQLRGLGFDVLNQANNHALDYGSGGQRQTLAALAHAGITVDGLPGQIAIRSVAGKRVAILGFAPYQYDANLLDIPAAQALVRRAAREASWVIVIIHAGAEGADQLHTPVGPQSYLGEDRGDARAFAHAVIDAGASIVVGSGPHVVRGIERYRHRLIAYSLGNFVGYHTLGLGGVLSESGILRVILGARGEVLGGRWISIKLNEGGLPRLDQRNQSAQLAAALTKEDFGNHTFSIGPTGSIRPTASTR